MKSYKISVGVVKPLRTYDYSRVANLKSNDIILKHRLRRKPILIIWYIWTLRHVHKLYGILVIFFF